MDLELIRREVLTATPGELRAYLSGARRDGTYNRRHATYRITQADRRWLVVLAWALDRLGSRGWIYREGNRNVWTLETKCNLEDAPLITATDHMGFARGYFDAEGGTPRSQSARFYVQLVQKDLADLSKVRGSLQSLGIACGVLHNPSSQVDPNYWRFFIRAQSFSAFSTTISSWHPRKRELLMARFDSNLVPSTLRRPLERDG